MRKARSSTGLFEWSAVHSDVARLKGFEPPASSLGGKHSIQLSYKRRCKNVFAGKYEIDDTISYYNKSVPMSTQPGRTGRERLDKRRRMAFRQGGTAKSAARMKMRFAFHIKSAIVIE